MDQRICMINDNEADRDVTRVQSFLCTIIKAPISCRKIPRSVSKQLHHQLETLQFFHVFYLHHHVCRLSMNIKNVLSKTLSHRHLSGGFEPGRAARHFAIRERKICIFNQKVFRLDTFRKSIFTECEAGDVEINIINKVLRRTKSGTSQWHSIKVINFERN